MNFSVVRGADTKWGQAFAVELARQKRHLVLLGKNAAALERVSLAIVRENKVRVQYRQVDDTDTASIIATADWINSHLEIDMLVNYAETGFDRKLADYDIYQLNKKLKTNYATGTLYVHQLLPNLLLHGQACIVDLWCSKFPVTPWEQALVNFHMRFSEYLNEEMSGADLQVRSYLLPACDEEKDLVFSDGQCRESASAMLDLQL